MAQITKTGALPVNIPGLPGALDAYPVYRTTTRDGREPGAQLLRLEIRPAVTQDMTAWRDAVDSTEPRVRDWMLKNRSGRSKRITERFGAKTLELLYQLCAAGFVVFDVEPPPGPDAPHGALISWRLSDQAQAHAVGIAHEAQARREELAAEAKQIAGELADRPRAQMLVGVLTAPRDDAYLEHAVLVARDYLAEPPRAGDARIADSGAAASRDVLARLGRGFAKDYALDPASIDEGGQGQVYGATHKATQVRAAFKRTRFRDEDSLARMRREIEAGRLFGVHPNIMPVIDADPGFQWFVMPLAAGTARTAARELQAPGELRGLVTAVCEALHAPHEAGWVHRDLKPENLLLLDGRWTVADWGLGRRPRGETSQPGRTRTGSGYGTEGFAAPELSIDAHEVGPPADVYSLGQVIGSILTGRRPQANIPLLPPSGPWRDVVEHATRPAPSGRPQNVSEFLKLLASVQ